MIMSELFQELYWIPGLPWHVVRQGQARNDGVGSHDYV